MTTRAPVEVGMRLEDLDTPALALALARAIAASPRIGDKLPLVPGHCDPTVNLYDWYVCVRKGVVEALWPITARGAVN